MKISRVSYSEALKKMDMKNSNLLTGVIPLFLPEGSIQDYINFYMYFNFSERKIYVTGHPTTIKLVSAKSPSSLLLFDFHPEYDGYLFSNIEASKVERIYSKFKSFMSGDSERHNVITELGDSLFIEEYRIYHLLSDNGEIGLWKHRQHLEEFYSDLYCNEMVSLPADGVRTRDGRWRKKFS